MEITVFYDNGNTFLRFFFWKNLLFEAIEAFCLFRIQTQEMFGFFFLPSGQASYVSELIHVSPRAVGKQTQDLTEPQVYEGLARCSPTKVVCTAHFPKY